MLIALIVLGAGLMLRAATADLRARLAPFQEQGYQIDLAVVNVVDEDPGEATLFLSYATSIETELAAPVAFEAHRVTFAGEAHKDVHVNVHAFEMLEGSRVEGDLTILGCHTAFIDGVVEGRLEVKGAHELVFGPHARVQGEVLVNCATVVIRDGASLESPIQGRYAHLLRDAPDSQNGATATESQ